MDKVQVKLIAIFVFLLVIMFIQEYKIQKIKKEFSTPLCQIEYTYTQALVEYNVMGQIVWKSSMKDDVKGLINCNYYIGDIYKK